MRWISFVMLGVIGWNASQASAAEPLVESYLHSGQLARGELELETALAAAPADDQIRFGLAVVQLVRGVERLGQSLHESGLLANNIQATFLRIPVPTNPDPSPITYQGLRRILEQFQSDLERVERTLSGIQSEDVSLPLRLADIRFDLTGSGQARERFIDLLKRMLGPGFREDPENPEFTVGFDRGDVAWLRAYCHLLMALIDLNLAVDTEAHFRLIAESQFAKAKFRPAPLTKTPVTDEVTIVDPARLRHFRLHMVKVCELNRESWAFIRAETDNRFEWLPNPRQTGVLRMPVTDQMVDRWLAMVHELESLLTGQKKIPAGIMKFIQPSADHGMNLRKFLDAPPDTIDWDRVRRDGVRAQYQDDKLPDVSIDAFIAAFMAFNNTLAVGYAAWFN